MTVISLASDPIYAAIRNYIAAVNTFNDFRGDEESNEHYELEQAFFDSQDVWWHTVPTTREGVKAKIAHFLNLRPVSMFGVTDEGLTSFLATITKAVDIIGR
jgi:hypothetical protein